MRHSLAALAGLLALAAPASGQPTSPSADTGAARTARWHVGLAADVARPVGTLKRNVDDAAGVRAYALLRLDRSGLASLRLQGGWLNYGHENQRSCLGTAPHCRVAVNVTTLNGIFSLAAGPQLTAPLGRGRAYGYGLVGISRFATLSGIDGGLVPEFVAADENFADGGVVWSGGVGLRFPVYRGASVDIGAGYESHGERDYLTEGGLTDRPDGSLGLDIKRSRADLFAIRIGVTAAVGRRGRKASPAQ